MNALDSTERLKSMAASPLAFFVRNGRLAGLAIVGCIMAGAFGIAQMPIESAPEVKIPIGTVFTVYPGASPEDMEKLVTDELEKEIQNLDDVKQISSTSRDGVSSIVVEFLASADLEESIADLRDAVDAVKSQLPSEAQDPVVEQIRIDDQAIVTFLLTGEAGYTELKKHADAIEDIVESISGVSKVEVSGLPEREMQIYVDRATIEGLELSILEVSNAIRQNHVDLPAGTVLLDSLYYQASLKGQFSTAEELQQLAVAERNGTVILLGDIAEIREGFAASASEAVYYNAKTGVTKQSIALNVFKKVGADLVQIVNLAKNEVSLYTEAELPSDLAVVITNDQSAYVLEDIGRLLTSAWQTILIIAITLFLALGARESLLAASSIPILYFISFAGLALIGSTFNFLTFFALILSLGIVVDTSIVIVEGMYEGLERDNLDAKNAALNSMSMFAAPLISGSLTTIGAFLPLGLMTGIMGEYVKHIPITINFTLVASLFTALMILPAIGLFIFKGYKQGVAKPKRKPPVLAKVFHPLSEWYGNLVSGLFISAKRRFIWLGGTFILFLGVFVLLGTGFVKFNLFAAENANFFSVSIESAEGTELAETRKITETVEDIIKRIPELTEYNTVYGAGTTNSATINVTLVGRQDRERRSTQISSSLRPAFEQITTAEVSIQEVESGPATGADIQIRLSGTNEQELQEFTARTEALAKQITGTTDVNNDLDISPGEFHVTLKRDRLAKFGVTANDIGRTIRTAIFGDNSLVINANGEETNIVVRLDYRNERCLENIVTQLKEAQSESTICRSTLEDISALTTLLLPTKAGAVPLSELVDITLQPAVTTIRHYNTVPTVSVRANVADGYILADVLADLQTQFEAQQIPESIRYSFGGENEDTAESLASLARATILAALIIIAILTYQFNSFRQVLLIMLTMPLAFMGVMYGLAIIRFPLSFPGLIGLTALIGIVVNDAIVLVDRMNINRASYDTIPAAVVAACKQRLEPVLITTITTALGVIPLIFSGDVFRDLAIVVSIGITVATVFTLVIIPIVYVLLEEMRGKPSWIKKQYMQVQTRVVTVFQKKSVIKSDY